MPKVDIRDIEHIDDEYVNYEKIIKHKKKQKENEDEKNKLKLKKSEIKEK